MTASDSLPIQFWDVDDETFNEKEVCGLVKQDCFCQPVQTDDEITLQFDDSDLTSGVALSVKAYDENDEAVGVLALTPNLGFQQITFSPADLNMTAGNQYILKIEAMPVLTASRGVFVLDGQDVALQRNGQYSMLAEKGTFTLSGQDITLTKPERYQLSLSVQTIDGVLSYSATFTGTIDNTTLSVPAPANGNSDSDTIASQSGAQSVDIDASKFGSGIALDNGNITFRKNTVVQDTINFGPGDPVNGSTTITNVMPGDLLEVLITEG